jgi:hypothetical protein
MQTQEKKSYYSTLPLISQFGEMPMLHEFRKVCSEFIFDAKIPRSQAKQILEDALRSAFRYKEEGAMTCEESVIDGNHYATFSGNADTDSIVELKALNKKPWYVKFDLGGYWLIVRGNGTISYVIDAKVKKGS